MKKLRMIASAVAIFAVVSSALAFKARSFGVIYCGKNQAGSCFNLIDYQTSTNTSDPTDPCAGGVTQEYAIINGVCTALSATQTYTPTLP
jgi:hypothetical protein